MFMMRVLLGLFLTMGVAQAENWYPLGKTGNEADDFKFAIDLHTIRKVDGLVHYWVRHTYANAQHSGHGAYAMTKDSRVADCNARISAVTVVVLYDLQGKVVKILPAGTRPVFGAVVPGSVGEIEITFACVRAEDTR